MFVFLQTWMLLRKNFLQQRSCFRNFLQRAGMGPRYGGAGRRAARRLAPWLRELAGVAEGLRRSRERAGTPQHSGGVGDGRLALAA